MVRIDCLIFGYRKIKISPDDLSLATSLLLRAGIPSKIASDASFTVRERDIHILKCAFAGKVEYEASEIFGLYGRYKRTRCKVGIFVGVIASIFLFGFFSNLVWDIRVDGNERIPDSAIVLILSESGFSVGDMWNSTDRSKIESDVLMSSSDIAWININRRGSVAYVTVAEKEQNPTDSGSTTGAGYANIVAAADCVIEEITVTRGTPEVKVGDVVRAGDLLISGVMPLESGGGFCYAEGIVIGRISDTVTAEVERIHTVRNEKKDKLFSKTLKIFDFSVNIFKSYGNSSKEYDIIKDIDTFSLFGKAKLPIEVITEYTVTYDESEERYTDARLVAVASQRLNAKLINRLTLADLVGIRTYGDYTDTGYRISSDIVFLADVSRVLEFDIEN